MSTPDLAQAIKSLELACPHCGVMHVDRGEWKFRPHRTHRCESCKVEWQPHDFPTRGILESGVSFAVPFIPPSVNHYKQPAGHGRYYVTDEAKAFIEAVVIFSRREPCPGPFFEVHVVYHMPASLFMRVDADNLEKVSFDALTIADVIPDDRYITYHTNRKLPTDDEAKVRTVYLVRGRKEP